MISLDKTTITNQTTTARKDKGVKPTVLVAWSDVVREYLTAVQAKRISYWGEDDSKPRDVQPCVSFRELNRNYGKAFTEAGVENVSLDHTPLSAINNLNKTDELLRIVSHYLDTNEQLITAYTLVPTPLDDGSGLIGCYVNDVKAQQQVQTAIKIRKFVRLIGVTGDKAEQLAQRLQNEYSVVHYDVRVYDGTRANAQYWRQAYKTNTNVASCMNNGYGVAKYNTFRCYELERHGIPLGATNGFKLITLWQNDKVVARVVGFTNDDGNFYLSSRVSTTGAVYGDNRLAKWLEQNGYKPCNKLPIGTTLVATFQKVQDDKSIDAYMPFVDAENTRFALKQHTNGRCYWELVPSEASALFTGSSCTGKYSYKRCKCGIGFVRSHLDGERLVDEVPHDGALESVVELSPLCTECEPTYTRANVNHIWYYIKRDVFNTMIDAGDLVEVKDGSDWAYYATADKVENGEVVMYEGDYYRASDMYKVLDGKVYPRNKVYRMFETVRLSPSYMSFELYIPRKFTVRVDNNIKVMLSYRDEFEPTQAELIAFDTVVALCPEAFI